MSKTFKMFCDDLALFNFKKDLPNDYEFRFYKMGESKIWAEIVTSAGEFNSIEDALIRFHSEFEEFEQVFSDRTVFLIDKTENIAIGTATAWFDLEDRSLGRLHWVSIRKEYQGRGLARPLIYEAVNLLKKNHQKAYLTTQDSSWKAIKVYEDCGFFK